MNKTFVFEMFIGVLVVITTIFFGVFTAMVTGLVLYLMLFLPPFSYHLRSLDERELILENKSERINGYVLLIILAIMFKFPGFEIGAYNLSAIWFPIAFGIKVFMDGALSLYLFNSHVFERKIN